MRDKQILKVGPRRQEISMLCMKSTLEGGHLSFPAGGRTLLPLVHDFGRLPFFNFPGEPRTVGMPGKDKFGLLPPVSAGGLLSCQVRKMSTASFCLIVKTWCSLEPLQIPIP